MINAFSLGLTSHCQVNCPSCSWGINKIPMNKREFYSWEYLENISKYIYGIDKVYIIGGEPTMHPNFAEWSPKFRELFGCKELYVWTNGYGNFLFPEVFINYDWVIMTKYTGKTFKGAPNNSEEMDFLFRYYEGKTTRITDRVINENGDLCILKGDGIPRISMGEIEHRRPPEVQKTGNCGRDWKGSNMVAYLDGKIFPCCGALYLPESVGIEPTENWREEITKLLIPCDRCLFAV